MHGNMNVKLLLIIIGLLLFYPTSILGKFPPLFQSPVIGIQALSKATRRDKRYRSIKGKYLYMSPAIGNRLCTNK